MRILITGGTGFVGSRLTKSLIDLGHIPVLLTRNKDMVSKRFPKAEVFSWDANSEEIPSKAFEKLDGIINLMGENISNKRWSDGQKDKLIKTRVEATKKLINGFQKTNHDKLDFFISASAVGYYSVNSQETLDENSPKGTGFLSDLCSRWEESAKENPIAKRQIIMRIGVVLGREGGALSKLLPIFKMGAGGPVGNGKQMMSWIHIDDLVKAIIDFSQEEQYQGVYNLVSPNPVDNKEFSKALAKGLKRPCLFPVPPIALKLMMGEMSTIVLDGQTVIPKRLMESNFQFLYPDINQAMHNL